MRLLTPSGPLAMPVFHDSVNVQPTMKFLIHALLVLAVAGCAVQPARQSPAEVRATHGYVYVAVPFAVGVERPGVTLRSLTSGEVYPLPPVEGMRDALGYWVPAGSYEVAEMVGNERDSYAPIQVEAGRLTDLGALAWTSVGDLERVLLPFRHPGLENGLTAAKEAMRGSLQGEVVAWKPTAVPKPQRHAMPVSSLGLVVDLMLIYEREVNKPPLRARLRETKDLAMFSDLALGTSPQLLGQPTHDAAGRLYVGSNYGHVRKRETDGTWVSLPTGTLSPITAVASSDAVLAAGTFHGALLVSADGGKTWSLAHRFDANEMVLDIDSGDGRWFVLTANVIARPPLEMLAIDSVQVYMSQAADLNGLRSVHRVPLSVKGTFMVNAVRGVMQGPHYFLSSFNRVERFDPLSATWKDVSPPHPVTLLHSASNPATLTAFRASGAFSKLSISLNGGDSWVPVETPPYPVAEVRLEGAGAGLAGRYDTGAFTSSYQLVRYDPATKTWPVVWTAPAGACASTLRDQAGMEKYCVSPGGSILRMGNGKLVPELIAD